MEKIEIQAVMTSFPHTVGFDQDLHVAKQLMDEHGVRHLPVQEGGKLIGVISDRDINFAMAVDHKDAEEITVADAATEEPYVVDLKEDVKRVAKRMHDDRIGCAIVVQSEAVVGIFTTTDACRALSEVLSGSIG